MGRWAAQIITQHITRYIHTVGAILAAATITAQDDIVTQCVWYVRPLA